MLLFVFCAQLAVAAPPIDSIYATAALRDLVARAAAANRQPPPDFRSYRSHVETELSLLLRDTLGRERAAQVEQLAAAGSWTRSGRYHLHVIGYRGQSVGVPYSSLSMVRAWTIPSLYGDRLLLGAYFNQSTSRRDTLVAVHPFAQDRDTYYRFTGGDTVTVLRSGSRQIPVVRIHVHPDLHGSTRVAAFDGEIDLDAQRAQIVRMRGRFVTVREGSNRLARMARAAGGVVAAAYAEFVNAEVDGEFWLPAFQRTEFQAGFALFGQTRPIFRLVSRIDQIEVARGSSPAGSEPAGSDSGASPRVIVTWAPSDSVGAYNGWERDLGALTSSVHADDFLDLAPDAWRPTGPPRFSFFPNSTRRILRFNRVEGLFTGLAPAVDFRSAVPGLRMGVRAGWAWTERTARGGAFVTYARGGSVLGIRAERTLASTNDFVLPLSDDIGIAALLVSADNADYVDRRSAMLSASHILRSVNVGLVTIQAGLGDDREEHARLSHGIIRRSGFRTNRGAAPGRYAIASADLELHPNVTGDYVQPGLGARVHYETARGDLQWQRAEFSVSARQYFGPVSVAAHADGGVVFGTPVLPPQQLFELGGYTTLPGYADKSFAGDRAALFRAFASYRLGVWRRPIRVWRNLVVPGLSPGLAVSAQGGWTELSSGSAVEAARRLGLSDGMPVATATGGMRATVGGGLTLFSDLVHIGVARPVDRPASWRFVAGLSSWF